MRLNAQQRQAVAHEGGPLLVLAGAGSGKTRVITARIARLIQEGVSPERILAVTFTNKAAQEMRERLTKMVAKKGGGALWLSTFHSFGVRFVREEAELLGLGKRFSVFDQGDSVGLVRELLRLEATTDRRLDAHAVLARISRWKNALETPSQVRPRDDEYDRAAAEVYGPYQARLSDMHAVDFDDLVIRPLQLLNEQPGVRERWRSRFDHILVDEFQDTNQAQLGLVRLLSNHEGNVCVVGDDDQAIYGWRGACVSNILDFEEHFPGARIAKLENNYRSTAPILNVANAAIAQARSRRHQKTLRATRTGGERVRICVLGEPQDEAKFVASEIRGLGKSGAAYGDIGVLYRSNNQAKLVEEELRIAGIDYRVFGGTKLFDRKEIKDAIAYLRIALNPRDELSLRRIINTPVRGLGAQSLRHLQRHSERYRTGLLQALRAAGDLAALAPRAQGASVRLAESIDRAARTFRAGRFAEGARKLLSEVGMLGADSDEPREQRRRAHLTFLLQSIERLERRSGPDREGLLQLLHHVSLDSSGEEDATSGRGVTLSSLHSAKGLEFSVVFLIGCIEGVLPHARTTDPKVTDASVADLEEERRLFYVGVTRARDLLYLTRPKERVNRSRLVKLSPSRFLEGLPEADIEDYQSRGRVEMERQEVAEMAKALLERLGSTP